MGTRKWFRDILVSYITVLFYVTAEVFSDDSSPVSDTLKWVPDSNPNCPCGPCYIGARCEQTVHDFVPRFNSRYNFVEVTGVQTIAYNATTYPGTPDCPCPTFQYSIRKLEHGLDLPVEEFKDTFEIDRLTGELVITKSISQYDLFRVFVSVRNTQLNATDEMMIAVARKGGSDPADQYLPVPMTGYDSPYQPYDGVHHISERAAPHATDVNFTLTKISGDATVKVGGRWKFQLDIIFPLATTDMLVELFAPDNDTTVMILCSVEVQSTGSSLIPEFPGTVVYDSKVGDNVTMADRAIINFGNVVHSQSGTQVDSTITIYYEAVMIDNADTVNGETYWVSAGAEYDNEQYIWVAQMSFTADIDLTGGNNPTFTVNGPSDYALGSVNKVDIEMQIDYPYQSYQFKSFTPVGTSGVMSICSVKYVSAGDNFGCGNNIQPNVAMEPDPTSIGNNQGNLDLGTLLNKASRDGSLNDAGNKVVVSFVAQMLPVTSLLATSQSIGMALEVGPNVIWIGSLDNTVTAAPTTGFTNPGFSGVVTDLTTPYQATIGEAFELTYTITVPQPASSGVASPYVMELLAPYASDAAIFSVCSFEVVSVGTDIPCLNKDDLVTEYTSRNGGSVPDKATTDLGYVMAAYDDAGEDTIVVKAILKPEVSHPSSTLGSTHDVALGVYVATNHLALHTTTVTLQTNGTFVMDTNSTDPSLTMTFPVSADIDVGGSIKVIHSMTTAADTNFPTGNMEILTKKDDTNKKPYFHVCKVEVNTVGENLPCIKKEWLDKRMQYTTQYNTLEMDRAVIPFSDVCNTGKSSASGANDATFASYIHFMPNPAVSNNANLELSTGVQYMEQKLWIGQQNLVARTDRTYSPTAANVYHTLTLNSSAGDLPLEQTKVYSLLMKMPSTDKYAWKLEVESTTEGLDICTVRFKYVGYNMPCVSDVTVSNTTTMWSNGGRKSVTLDAGVITNFGSTTDVVTNNYADGDTLIIEIIVKANKAATAGTYGFTAKTILNSAGTTDFTDTINDIIITTDMSSVNKTIGESVTATLTVGELFSSDTDTNIAIGEVNRILLTATIPRTTNYELEMQIIIPSEHAGKVEVCDAAIAYVGKHLPCLYIKDYTTPNITSRDNIYQDTVTFTFSYVCSHVLDESNPATEDQVIIEAYVRIVPNGLAAAESTVSIGASVQTFTTKFDISALTLTVKDPSTFSDKYMYQSTITNATAIALDQSSPLSMTIGQNLTIQANVTIPSYSAQVVHFDLELPVDDSACLTVRAIRVLGSPGRNVLCIPATVNTKNVEYTPVYNDSIDNGQHNYVFLDVGIVTNTGVSYRLDTYIDGDDVVMMEVDIQMADCAASIDGAEHTISFGSKVANAIYIYDNNVTVSRDNNEKPDFAFEMIEGSSSTSSVKYIEGIIYHTNTSTAEGINTTVQVYLPSYQLAPSSVTLLGNKSYYNITSDPAIPNLLEINFDRFFFTDHFRYRFEVTVNPSVELSAGFSAADTAVYGEVLTEYNMLGAATTYASEDWYPFVHSSLFTLSYSVDAGTGTGCATALGMQDGTIQNCQISGSLYSVQDQDNARLGGSSAWEPFIRDNYFRNQRYIDVYFGNVAKVSKVAVQQNGGHAHKVNGLGVYYSNDGVSWFGMEMIDMGASPSSLEEHMLSKHSSRYIRIFLTNDTSGGVKPNVGVKFELYGCYSTNDVTPTQACANNPAVTVPSDFSARSFVVGSSSQVFVCDRDISKLDETYCITSSDGNIWQDLDPRIACVIGYESTENELYAYDKTKSTLLMSSDGVIWKAVDSTKLADSKSKTASWSSAVLVPEDLTIDNVTPLIAFTRGQWGATYEGMYFNSVLKMSWTPTS